MESHYNEHRDYAYKKIQDIEATMYLASWQDPAISQNYDKFLEAKYDLLADVENEINEQQQLQDLPTKKKINKMIKEAMMEVFVDEDERISLKKRLKPYKKLVLN